MNQVVSFNMERRYAATMKQCSDLTRLQNKFNSLQKQLSNRTNSILNSESIQKLITTYKVQQLAIKSEYDKKRDDLKQDTGVKDMMLSKIINKNKVLLLEKSRHLGLLKRKGRKDKAIDYKHIIEILE